MDEPEQMPVVLALYVYRKRVRQRDGSLVDRHGRALPLAEGVQKRLADARNELVLATQARLLDTRYVHGEIYLPTTNTSYTTNLAAGKFHYQISRGYAADDWEFVQFHLPRAAYARFVAKLDEMRGVAFDATGLYCFPLIALAAEATSCFRAEVAPEDVDTPKKSICSRAIYTALATVDGVDLLGVRPELASPDRLRDIVLANFECTISHEPPRPSRRRRVLVIKGEVDCIGE